MKTAVLLRYQFLQKREFKTLFNVARLPALVCRQLIFLMWPDYLRLCADSLSHLLLGNIIGLC